jgi:hypothetical protein
MNAKKNKAAYEDQKFTYNTLDPILLLLSLQLKR